MSIECTARGHGQRPELDDACFARDLHDLHEQRLKVHHVLLPKLRDRPVRRKVARRQHAIGYIVFSFRAIRRDENVPVA